MVGTHGDDPSASRMPSRSAPVLTRSAGKPDEVSAVPTEAVDPVDIVAHDVCDQMLAVGRDLGLCTTALCCETTTRPARMRGFTTRRSAPSV